MKLLGIVLLLGALSPALSAVARGLPRPYLALFSFGLARLPELANRQLRLLNTSPYDGMATWWAREYSVNPPPRFQQMLPRLRRLRQMTRKDLWPFAFLNRIVEGSPKLGRWRFKPVYGRIRGMDLDNATGSLHDFLLTWRRNLEIARFLKSPGVGLDPEFYNTEFPQSDLQFDNLSLLARYRGEAPAKTRRELLAIGARMASIVRKVYPGAAIWCLRTGLGDSSEATVTGCRPVPPSVAGYIVEGLLDRANEAHIPLTLFEGSEPNGSSGYLLGDLSVAQVREVLRTQDVRYRPWLKLYPQLVLGGTVAPWLDTQHLAYWMEGCRPIVSTIEGFKPYFATLMEHRRFVWIYAAGGAYNVWDKPYCQRFPPVLAAAKEEAAKYLSTQRAHLVRVMPAIRAPAHVTPALGTVVGDLGRPVEQTGIHLDHIRTPRGVLQVGLTPKVHHVGGGSFVAVLSFSAWPGGEAWRWPMCRIPLGKHTDWLNYRGLALEVYNPGAEVAELGVDIHSRQKTEFNCYYTVPARHGGVIYIPSAQLRGSLDIAKVRSLALLMRYPTRPTRFYLSDMVLVK